LTAPITHLEHLVSLGPRPIGSPANQAAADYIRDNFRAIGLDVEEQPYPCTVWEHRSTRLSLGNDRLDCTANPFSPACDVTAPVVAAGTLAELEAAPARAKILLLYGDLLRAPISPKAWFLKDERSVRMVELLEQIRPAALLAPPSNTGYFGTMTEDQELNIPAATVPRDVALRLLREPVPATLAIDARNVPATARNIVARTPSMPEQRVVICAHFDTKINTPGACDNAAGAAALLTLAEKLPHLALPFGLEFVAFNGEEYLPIGDDTYVDHGNSYWGQIGSAINLDGIGFALGSTSVTAMPGPESFIQKIQESAKEFSAVAWVDPWPESNHSTFAMRGIPAVAVGSSGAHNLAHFPNDTLDGISPEKLNEAVQLVGAIITHI
jgi:aminopeptidase YwaD